MKNAKNQELTAISQMLRRNMTKEERQDPSILNASRRKRIAAGCGLPVSRINTLIKRYEETKKMLKQFSRPGAMKKNRMLRGLF